MVKLVVPVAGSAIILKVSRRSSRDRQPHDLYCFLTWEALLLFIPRNLDRWFIEPFSPLHILAWPLLLAPIRPEYAARPV